MSPTAAKQSSAMSAPQPRGLGGAINRRNNPLLLDMHRALRCHAKSKRSGLQCRAPAVRGFDVCRMHGAGGGAPKGNQNALKHGEFAADTLTLKKEIAALARLARATIGEIE